MPNNQFKNEPIFTKEQLKCIKRATLGKKHGVTGEYVGQLLRGDKEANTDVAKAILEDAVKIIEINS